MLFKNPNLLYALFTLIIPIIVHLFQLRRFQKVAFTNVAMLKKLELQTRKSAVLKKWLVLFSRLGLFAMLILAFAKPYFLRTVPKVTSEIRTNTQYLVLVGLSVLKPSA